MRGAARMADHQKEQDRRPLLYKVEPQEGEQITTQRKPEVKHEQMKRLSNLRPIKKNK